MGNSQSTRSSTPVARPTPQTPTAPRPASRPREQDLDPYIQIFAALRVDWGTLTPQNGLYPPIQQQQDPPQIQVIRNLILDRRIAPFYKGLADVSEKVAIQDMDPGVVPYLDLLPPDNDLSENLSAAMNSQMLTESRHRQTQSVDGGSIRRPTNQLVRLAIPANSIKCTISKEDLYKDPIECPICFLVWFGTWTNPQSSILTISIGRDVAINPYARNASFKLKDRNLVNHRRKFCVKRY
jgi:hypothetical protein